MSKNNFPGYKTLDFSEFTDEKGVLRVLNDNILPFRPKRIFTLQSTNTNLTRGNHGHFECQQVMFAQNGIVDLNIVNVFGDFHEVLTDSVAFFLPPGNWCSLKFRETSSSVVVLASHEFLETDYFYDKPLSSKNLSK